MNIDSLKTPGPLSSRSDPLVYQVLGQPWVQSESLFQNLNKTLDCHITKDPKAKNLENI